MRAVLAFPIGVVFGIGIVLAGMANPAKVLNFFDLAGSWDPSLAFVMGGALAVTALGYRLVLGRPKPVLEAEFQLPKASRIDPRLIAGAAIFGIGWGIAGFCPGGAIPALGTGLTPVIVFVLALIAGIAGTRAALDIFARQSPPAGAQPSKGQLQGGKP